MSGDLSSMAVNTMTGATSSQDLMTSPITLSSGTVTSDVMVSMAELSTAFPVTLTATVSGQ